MMAVVRQRTAGRGAYALWFGFLFLLLALPGRAASTDVQLTVNGVEAEIRDNVIAYVGKLTLEDLQSWRATRARLNENVSDALRSLGYYNPDFQIDHTRKAVLIHITAGEPVRVRKLALVFQGEAGNDIAFTALREHMPLHEGDVMHHGKYESLKSAIQNLGLDRGYFDAEWKQHEVNVDPVTHTADIELVYDSGTRYRFGPVSFLNASDDSAQTLVRPELLQRFLTFSEGDPYDASAVIKFNKILLDSRFFSQARVHVERDKAVDRAIPIEVRLGADKPNNVDFGIGYSTDVKERLTVKWTRPLINERGHSIEANTELSPVRSSFDAKYTVPLTHPIDDTLQYFYGVKRENVEEVITWNTVLGLQRQIKRESGWQRTYSLRWLRDTTEPPNEEEVKKDLLLPGISLDRTRTKGGIDPYWGDRQYYQAEAGSKVALSDANLISLRGGIRFLRTLADKHQFLLRGDAGTILTNNFDDVPQSMRFFAGGDQSIRGYGYKSISPRDENGVAVGARNLLTGSAEYDYTFIPRWRAAIFVDGGSAFDDFSEPFHVGTGIGIRWVSPVGPIRLDLASAITEPGKPLRIHFSMGPNL